jgi:CubicO group peptidase (beta-lactamase class C family)
LFAFEVINLYAKIVLAAFIDPGHQHKSENMSVKSYLTCLKVSLVLIFLQFFQFGQRQYNFSSLDQKLEAAKKELGGSAVAVIYKDGKVIYQGEQKTIGEFNAKTQAPIGGASQWLTAALVMSFVDEGKLSLDDKVSKFLPVFTKYSKGYITIRHCISHLTGIESDTRRKKFSSLEEEVDDYRV